VVLAVGLTIGAMSGMINVYVMTLLQGATPGEMRGRGFVLRRECRDFLRGE